MCKSLSVKFRCVLGEQDMHVQVHISNRKPCTAVGCNEVIAKVETVNVDGSGNEAVL
jgi:hypothetical protein